jgi:hypothetical protein
MEKIIEIVCNEILHAKNNTVQLLQLQNHLYGCFVLMEDITEKNIVLDQYHIKATNHTVDLDHCFSQIGIRYGFAMDTTLLLKSYLPAYKEGWLAVFKSTSTLEEVDRIEDGIIALITAMVPPEHAFFLHAMDKGQLPQEWVHKVLAILLPEETVPVVSVAAASPSDSTHVNPIASAIAQANPEKPMKRLARFQHTRRHTILIKKPLAKTRRSMKLHGLKV